MDAMYLHGHLPRLDSRTRVLYHILMMYPRAVSPPSLYRRHFSPAELRLLEHFAEDDGSSEIDLLRVGLARLLALSHNRRGGGWTRQAEVLSVSFHSARILAALTRCRIILARGRPDPLLESIAVDDLADL